MGKLRNLLIAVMTLLSFGNVCYGSCDLSCIQPQSDIDQELLKELQIDLQVQERYKTSSKMFSYIKKGNILTTNQITYETLQNGVHCHVGWYVDGFITTALDGYNAGRQVVIVNNQIVSVSDNIVQEKGYFLHYHIFGVIESHANKQIVYFY